MKDALPDVTVEPGKPLILKGPGPVVVHYGTVTLVEGGQILVQTPVEMTAQVLRKVPGPDRSNPQKGE